MAVLIEGINIPKGNPITINIYRDGTWVNAYNTEDGNAIEVPEPHGDLIDASEKIRVQMYDDEHEDFHTEEMTIDDLLSQSWVKAYAFPVIPASKEG